MVQGEGATDAAKETEQQAGPKDTIEPNKVKHKELNKGKAEGGAKEPNKAIRALLGGSRVKTIRKKLRVGEKLSLWLWLTRRRPWPQRAADVVDYIHAAMAEAPWLSFRRGVGAMHARRCG